VWVTVKWTRMRKGTTESCLKRKGSGIVTTQETSGQKPCRTLIFYVQDFLAKLSPSLEKEVEKTLSKSVEQIDKHTAEKEKEIMSV